MRVLIYSDVHANWEALTAMEAATAGAYDASVCLGDVVGYGASPNSTAAWVRERTPVVIRGNHDRACASLDGIQHFNAIAAEAARWTHHQLTPEHEEWLRALPPGPRAWEGASLVHGSPLDEDEYLLEPAQAAASFVATADALIWFGHTHVQGGYVLAEEQVASLGPAAAQTAPPASAGAHQVRLTLRPGARYLINPGSVGQPRDGDWRAAYALYEPEAGSVVFHRVPYDLAQAQARILEANLPPRLAHRLALGR